MIHVSILALKNAVLASIADSRYVFAMVNEFLKQSGRPAVFDVQLVALSEEVKLNNGLFSIHPDIVVKDLKHTDLIIIPALSGDIMTATSVNRDYLISLPQKAQP